MSQGTLYQPRGVGWGGEGDGREVLEGEDLYKPVAGSCWCLTENNKIL